MENKQRDILRVRAFVYSYLINQYTDYCVFFDYSGHIDSIDIRIRKSKKEYDKDICETTIRTKYYEYQNEGRMDAMLEAKVDVLKSILDTKEIPYELMEEQTIEVISTHNF